MQQEILLKVKPEEAQSHEILCQYLAEATGKPIGSITGFRKLKQSLDARSRSQIWINLRLLAFIDEPFIANPLHFSPFPSVAKAKHRVIIIGAGPAGLFAALQLIELGIQPIILERGKDVRARRRDLASLNKDGVLNPESNYCFGEGGAGTYSDGKLYTRSNKRGNIHRILERFVQFGAAESILYEAHPHIGTNKLPNIITAMREAIEAHGGQLLFEQKLTDFTIEKDNITRLFTEKGAVLRGDAVILATGHSARDIYELLHAKGLQITAKSFALGVRIEHPQTCIDSIQYHLANGHRGDFLPPAAYSLVEQVNGRGAFSFCMCPGGIIAPAATSQGALVVNGWSPSKRNNPYANSGMVVSVDVKDAIAFTKEKDPNNPLVLLHFQTAVEQHCYQMGGGGYVAPAQRMADFCANKPSADLPACSYGPGIKPIDLRDALPSFITKTLQAGFQLFGKKMKGFLTNEAVVVATESRTSSPVRIPRDETHLYHPQIMNLYPCGEGAGYAGGIVSAAMDGERVAKAIAEKLGGY